MTEWGLEAATVVADQIADERGMTARLLRFGSNGLFALDDRVVLRVCPPTRRVERGLSFARLANAHGVPVLPPLSHEVVQRNGLQVTEWPYKDEQADAIVDYRWLGTVARQLHDLAEVLAHGCQLNLSSSELGDTQLSKIGDRLFRLHGSHAFEWESLHRLDGLYEKLRKEWPTVQWADSVVLHGDLYGGNVLVTNEGARLIDFDQVAIGPRTWDEIPVAVQVRRFGLPRKALDDFSDGYGESLEDDPGYDLLLSTRELASVTWVAVLSLERPELMSEVHKRLHTIEIPHHTSEHWTPF